MVMESFPVVSSFVVLLVVGWIFSECTNEHLSSELQSSEVLYFGTGEHANSYTMDPYESL